MTMLKKFDHWVGMTARGIASAALAAIFVMFLLNVFVRFCAGLQLHADGRLDSDLPHLDDFPGGAGIVRTRSHFVVDVLTERLSGTDAGRAARVAVTLIELVMYAVICWYGWVWVLRSQAYFQSIPWLQVRWAYAAIPVSAGFMTIYGVRDFVEAVLNFCRHREDISVIEDKSDGF